MSQNQTTKATQLIALKKAITKAGGQKELAKLINCKSATQVGVMLNRDQKASAKYVLKIHQATGVPLHELRPDLYPAPAANDESNDPQTA